MLQFLICRAIKLLWGGSWGRSPHTFSLLHKRIRWGRELVDEHHTEAAVSGSPGECLQIAWSLQQPRATDKRAASLTAAWDLSQA